ncbi:hypothetical protein RM550_35020 [Streptomyces sp. DSM 41527]|uniref:GNAT family N-acetyltransferase n=1 Tax=Streptomyces mooreae TaxID=3075523 RepID=A0ABU2TIZ1_9ACTN|nr:hypothetical protein [Streptomyces sp. DSM 41527]
MVTLRELTTDDTQALTRAGTADRHTEHGTAVAYTLDVQPDGAERLPGRCAETGWPR